MKDHHERKKRRRDQNHDASAHNVNDRSRPETADQVPWRTKPPRPLNVAPPQTSLDRKPRLTVSQSSFVAIAVVGALVTGIFLIASLSGPRSILDNEVLDRLAEEHQQTTGVSDETKEVIEMTVLTDPALATVYVDFESVGTTPMSPVVLKDGTYVLSVSKPGYVTVDTLVTLRAGDQPFFWFTLQPLQLEGLGEISEIGRDVLRTEADVLPQFSPSQELAMSLSETEQPTGLAPPRRNDEQSTSDQRRARGATERPPNRDNQRPPDNTREPAKDRDTDEASAGVSAAAAGSSTAEPAGTLSILVRPWGAIFINEELHRSNTDVIYSVELEPGEYSVRAVHPTLGVEQRSVRVDPASSRQVIFDLNRRRR